MTTNPTLIPHPSETYNRKALVRDIVTYLDGQPGMFASGRASSYAVEQFGPAVWAEINRGLGRERPLSTATIQMVVGFLAGREG